MAVSERSPSAGTQAAPHQGEVVYRHTLVVRATHWINVLCLTLLLLSGLKIFNYHPALYWGNYGYRGVPAVVSIEAATDPATGEPVGVTRVAGWSFVTTGVLGVSYDSDRGMVARAFPSWLTLPGADLGLARDWHFLMAWLLVVNGAVYLLFGVLSGHFRRDLAPAAGELRPRHMLAEVWDHIRLRTPPGGAARRYNVLQKLAYVAVSVVLLAGMVRTRLT